MDERKVLKHWHLIFGAFLTRRYRPVEIFVETEVSASVFPPVFDILLLRREHLARWSPDQRAILPDGIRDSHASRIVIEFKYTESLGVRAVRQAVMYDELYLNSQSLSQEQVSTYLISSKSPSRNMLERCGFVAGSHPGLYHNPNPVLERVNLIILNELSDESHNLAFKLFASKRKVKKDAFARLRQNPEGLPEEVIWFARTLELQEMEGGDSMITDMTEEEILELGKRLGKSVIRGASIRERLEGLPSEEVLKQYSNEERVAGIPLNEILKSVDRDELEAYFEGIPEETARQLRIRFRLTE